MATKRTPGITTITGRTILLTNGRYLKLYIEKSLPDPDYLYGYDSKTPQWIHADHSIDHIKKWIWAYAQFSVSQIAVYTKHLDITFDDWLIEKASRWKTPRHEDIKKAKADWRYCQKEYRRKISGYSLTDHVDKMRLQEITYTTETIRTIIVNQDYL